MFNQQDCKVNSKLEIVLLNVNGVLLNVNDVMLISEIYFTYRSHMKIPDYVIYLTNHLDDKAIIIIAAIIVKSKIKHYQTEKVQKIIFSPLV